MAGQRHNRRIGQRRRRRPAGRYGATRRPPTRNSSGSSTTRPVNLRFGRDVPHARRMRTPLSLLAADRRVPVERRDRLFGRERHAGDDGDVVAEARDQILAELGEQLPRRAEVRIVRAVEKHHSQRPGRGAPSDCDRARVLCLQRTSRPCSSSQRRTSSRLETEQALGARHVERTPRLSVGLRGVPDDLAARSRSAPRSCPARSRIEISNPAPMFTGSLAVVALGRAARSPRRQSSTYRNSRVALPSPQTSTCGAPPSAASTHFRISAGITCELSGSKLSPRPVEVDRQQVDRVEAVLLPVGLRLDQQHLLGQPVWRVGLLRIAVPQVVFAERHRRELGIAADRADARRTSRRRGAARAPSSARPSCRLS